ncbi:hypothetical protein [Teredinibacter sp. KSP-S5-2]|uniref:hypothetical protein n=1 Tax=Teredinibacter sp. KSP-S5-2 TaxID=3034506 RepID=UPI0029347A86|nr:hypothetical protein [Teredinibacter sp. KSP-S5-2]WNO07771.1 hypothetical protein P5V12_12300 [Teredinibacter sp. KSP-S5-2]
MKTKNIFVLMLVLLSAVSMADTTNNAEIRQINYNAADDYLFFLTNGRWEVKAADGSISCNPVYVQVNPDLKGRDKLLSIGLAAKLSKSAVRFVGSCRSDNQDYFITTYAIIE